MAKGKQASLAANRRYEAAVEHLDRVTTELVEAKARARRFESDAARVPGLVAEVERLRQQTQEGTSDEVERVRAAASKRVDRAEKDLHDLLLIVRSMFQRVNDRHPDLGIIEKPEMQRIAAMGGTWAIDVKASDRSRVERRAQVYGGTELDRGDTELQDNMNSKGDNIGAARGFTLPKAATS